MNLAGEQRLIEERVLVAVRRRAGAQEAETSVVAGADLVPRAGRDENRIAGSDVPPLALELHLARAVDNDVDLLALCVVVALRRLARLQRRLGERLLTRRRRPETVQLPDRAAVRGRERLGRLEGSNLHGSRLSPSTPRF